MTEKRYKASDSQAVMRIHLLGPRQITWAGEPLSIQRRQPRAILYYLAAQADPVSRSRICFLFWPDLPEPDARRHLSNQVYNLRRALPDRDIVQTMGDRLALDHRRIWSDVVAFERLSQSSEMLTLQQAVDLYRGPFLDGFSLTESKEYDLWSSGERRNFERLYLEDLSTLLVAYASRGDYDMAIDCARHYLDIDDLAEGVHRQLIDLYAATGNRVAALRQYERCVAVLERELGVDPMPETREVYQSVLNDRRIPVEPLPTPPSRPISPSLETPLVGREEVLNQLNIVFDRAREGKGSVVLISGEPGVGKSRLLEEFLANKAHVTSSLVGIGYEAEGETPLLPLLEALPPLFRRVDWVSLDADPFLLAQLLPLLPELRRYIPDLPESLSPGREREESTLFRGLAYLMGCLARSTPPLVLCLDDIHWMDKATRSWISYMGRHIRDLPLLLLGTYRMEEAPILEPLRASLARQGVLEEVKLRGLGEQEVVDLIAFLTARAEGGERFCQRLHRQTGGNPFFLLEVLQTLFETGVLQGDEKDWSKNLDQLLVRFDQLPWPGSVTETVRQRVSLLSPITVQVLETCAILGRRFELDVLRAVSGRSEFEVVDALDELNARQLLLEDKDHYQFRHDLIQAIVYGDLSYGRRHLLHRRAGELLEQTMPEDVVSLARHFAAAGVVEKSTQYALKAGDLARRVFAYQEATDFYRRALDWQEKQRDLNGAGQTLIRLGLAHQIGNDYKSAHQAFERSFILRRQARSGQQLHRPPASRPLHLSLHSLPHRRLLLAANSGLDPADKGSREFYIKQLFIGLLSIDRQWTVRPEVARAWEISKDGRRYTFHLRDDVVWSDGIPVTADDFEFAWRRILFRKQGDFLSEHDMASGVPGFELVGTTDPASVATRAVDPLTLQIDLAQPSESFLNLLTDHRMVPVPRHVVEQYGQTWTEPDHIVTNGPFRLTDLNPGESVTLGRNPIYFGQLQGNLKQVTISNRQLSPADQLAAYRAGQMDLLTLTPETYQARFQHAEAYHQEEVIETYVLGFGDFESPLGDRRVRQALALAIDRGDPSLLTMDGFYRPATGGLLPPGFAGHSPRTSLPYDPEKGRRMLATAGYPEGRGFPRLELSTIKSRIRQAQILQSSWEKQLRIHIKLKVLTRSDFFSSFLQAPLFIVGWSNWHLDPYNFLRAGARALGGHWHHPGFDRLIQEAGRSTDQGERMNLCQQADRLLMQEAAIVPLYYGVHHSLVKPWLKISPPYYSLKDAILKPH